MAYAEKNSHEESLSPDNVKKNVLPFYGLENADIIQIKFKDTDKQRAVYKIENSSTSYCLKKVYFNEEELLFVYSAIEWLYRCGLNVPRILPTLNKDRYIAYDNMLFILTPWIEGSKCSYDNPENVVDASFTLGKMHKVTKNFIPIKGSLKRCGFDDIYSSTMKHMNQLLNCSNAAYKHDDKFSKLFLKYFDDIIKLVKLSLETAASINKDNLTTSLCHLDYVNKNLIFDENENLWIIDFDKCKIDYCYHDIGYFLRRLLKRDNTKWDLELAINSIKNYEKNHKLNIDDYKAILSYLSFPQKYWKISRDYYNNINKCNKNAFNTLLSKICEKNDNQIEFSLGLKKYIDDTFKQKI